jgi:hypothetical protein
MKLLTLILGLCLLATAAEARPRHHHSHHGFHRVHHHRFHHAARETTYAARPATVASSNSGRPSDCYGIPWCGCWLRHVTGHMDKVLNLAAAWLHVGAPTGPEVGAVVIWPNRHHVGRIVGQSERGLWLVQSGNYANRVATVSIRFSGGFAFRRV